MHTSVATLLTLLIPATLAIPRVHPNSDVDVPVIPSEVLYYYRYNHIPLDVYFNGLTNDLLLGENQDAVNKAIGDMTCGPKNLHICPSLQWFCNADLGRCDAKKLIGEPCTSPDSCLSGMCHSMCAKPERQFGAKCMDDSHCNPGLVCRHGLYSRDQMQCLDKVDRFYGASCTNNNDCDRPLVCNEVTVRGAKNICSMPEDRTGDIMCINNGELCGADSQCCSSKCQVMTTSRMPRCTA